MKRLPIILALLMLALPVAAAPRDPMPSVYEVEMIVFQNNLPDLEGGELWSQDRVDTDIKNLDKAVTVKDQPDPNSDLSKVIDKLGGDDSSYRILFHKHWVEEAKPEDDAELIHINSDDGELDGTLKFYLSRYLHLDVNLLLKEPVPTAQAQTGTAPASGSAPASDVAPASAPEVMYYRIAQERRIRAGDIQYFDHPKFGALIEIKPVLGDSQ